MLRDTRTVPRYFLTPALDGFIDGEPVRVIDIGRKGIRIELYGPLPPGKSVTLVFASITVQAQVLWCQVDALNFVLEQDQYLAGLVFEERSLMVDELLGILMAREAAIPITENRSADRYRITAPLTGSYGSIAPVSLLDLSIRGARFSSPRPLQPGTAEHLRFQVDEDGGPVNVRATVKWCRPAETTREHEIGLQIAGEEETMRRAILRLCMRNEARIELDSLKRKFDALRVAGRAAALQPAIAV